MLAEIQFDDLLARVPAQKLKRMAETWGGHKGMRKDACIRAISQGLNNPKTLQKVVDNLTEFERLALTLLKQHDGVAAVSDFALELYMAGYQGKTSKTETPQIVDILTPLVGKGLILGSYEYDPSQLSAYNFYRQIYVLSDYRLLNALDKPGHIIPLNIRPIQVKRQYKTQQRNPANILLDFIHFLQSFEELGGLRLTKSYTIRKADLKKLTKLLGWKDDLRVIDGFELENPIDFFLGMLLGCSILDVAENEEIILMEPLSFWLKQDPVDIVRRLVSGFVNNIFWYEQPNRNWGDYQDPQQNRGRVLALLALKAIPPDFEGLLSLTDFSDLIFERVGYFYSLDGAPEESFRWRYSPGRDSEATSYRDLLYDAWQNQESQWFKDVFASWLYILGIVKLSFQEKTPRYFEFTPLGEAVFYRGSQSNQPSLKKKDQPAWVIQPNFDLVVYMDQVNLEDLFFLETHAERLQAEQHIAQYHLTQQSIYRGLENGSNLDGIIATLEAKAKQTLPPNVRRELEDWSKQREKLSIFTQIDLLEFESSQARDQVLGDYPDGEALGERYIVFKQGNLTRPRSSKMANYVNFPQKTLSITEDGLVSHQAKGPDILIESQLARWAEALGPNQWRLTPKSVGQRAQKVSHVNNLIQILENRLTHPLPNLLSFALKAWAGSRIRMEKEALTVVQCSNFALFEAITQSERFRPYIKAKTNEGLFFVEDKNLAAFEEALNWLGLNVSDQIKIKRG